MNSSDHYKNKKILITGGAGFIGSHLVEAFLNQQSHVTIFDNFSSGTEENIAAFKKDITVIKGNVEDYKLCNKAAQNQDYVFHLAAFVCVPTSFDDPQQCYLTNALGTFNLLEASFRAGVSRFMFSSSCAVYGPTEKPCSEVMPCDPTSPYGYSKLSSELYCQQYAKLFDLPSLCLRYFNVFGTRQAAESPYAGVVAKFKKAMERNESIIIFGDGNQTRDFISVEEVVKANMNLALLPRNKMNGQPVNIGTGLSQTILDLFNELKKEYNYTKNPIFMPSREGDLVHSASDMSKYHALIKTVKTTHTTI